jgi:hypothetical protein
LVDHKLRENAHIIATIWPRFLQGADGVVHFNVTGAAEVCDAGSWLEKDFAQIQDQPLTVKKEGSCLNRILKIKNLGKVEEWAQQRRGSL